MTTQLPPGVLLPAEWVQARARLSRGVYLPAVFIAVLWSAVFGWATVIGVDLLALLAAAVVGVIVPALGLWTFWRRRTTTLLLTDQRLVALQGPFPRRAGWWVFDLEAPNRYLPRHSQTPGLRPLKCMTLPMRMPLHRQSCLRFQVVVASRNRHLAG